MLVPWDCLKLSGLMIVNSSSMASVMGTNSPHWKIDTKFMLLLGVALTFLV
jgi:hypothetical protein